MICSAIAFWVPMASMLTTAPLMSSNASSRGIASISLLLWATATCPKTVWFSRTKALTRWAIPLLSQLRVKLRRIALPSMATSLPRQLFTSSAVQALKHRSKASGSNSEKTRPKVSWEGIPSDRSKNVVSHLRLALANNST
ncbi:MAG TPA: hypothetical protein VHY37_02160, partial [Tepidisphaeraceae bacterium]|nr:hypothetical protein [Tepidisphaeraceae bacterium]